MSKSEVAELPVLQGGSTAPRCPPTAAGELSQADAEKTAATLKALSDPVRLPLFFKITSRLGGKACMVAAMATTLDPRG
ncbi:hypothetical protein [Streptomyces sp. TRM49041]|uniref:hypothetical protein n=1 Tax=Streptomyces sp. TRM49041 TaxID=2603216 RepID=UPI0011EBC224|nr:hypothetical protein [Streptomyces sp. TRM49041]